MAKKTTKTTTKARPTNTSKGLLDFYNNGVTLPKLKEGRYTAQIIKHEAQKPKTIDGQPFIRFELQLPDRVIVDNKFLKGFEIMLDQLKTQLGLEDSEMIVQDFLDDLIGKDIDIWIIYAKVEGKGVYRNVNYIAPQILPSFEEDIENSDDDDEETTEEI